MIIEQNLRERIIAHGDDPKEDGGVYSALISAPYAHPLWSNYWLYACHLREIIRDGKPLPTIIYLEGATHEMWLYALDPDLSLEQQDERLIPAYLTPMNFGAQLIRPSDDSVREEMMLLAREIESGRMNPDTDYARMWRQRFGDNMVKPEWR
jgi:hypothetical protein